MITGPSLRVARFNSSTVLLWLIAIYSPLCGQPLGESLQVQVLDSRGRPIPGVRIIIEGRDNSFAIEAATSLESKLTVPRIPPGRYQVRAEAPGFEPLDKLLTIESANKVRVLMFRLEGERTSKPPAPPPLEQRTIDGLRWNTWLERRSEEDQPTFTPVHVLRTNTSYRLVLDLSALSYEAEAGIYTTRPSESFRQLLERWQEPTIELDVLLITDNRYFIGQKAADRFKRLVIDVKKMKSLVEQRVSVPKALQVAAINDPQYRQFVFGRNTFDLRTESRKGTSFLSLSIWHNDLPIDELTLPPACIVESDTDPCERPWPTAKTFAGIDSGLIAAHDRRQQPVPTAALHFIDLDERGTYCVLKCNDCPQAFREIYYAWRIDRGLVELANEMSGSIYKNIEHAGIAKDTSWLEEGGRALANLLLSGDYERSGPKAVDVLGALVTHASGGAKRSLFIRAVSNKNSLFLLLPLGLMAVPVNNTTEFLGFHFRIEMPLDAPDYTPATRCVDRWVMLVPYETLNDSGLKAAKAALQTWLEKLVPLKEFVKVFEDPKDFGAWISNETDKGGNTAVLIMSHHDNNRIYMDPAWTIPASNFKRKFSKPSLVIFNACGTAKPGDMSVIRRLSNNGITAVVATWTEVQGRMAGKFSALLLETLSANNGKGDYTLSHAVFDATRQLSIERMDDNSDRPFGAFALLFSLVGNGGIRVCTPSANTR